MRLLPPGGALLICLLAVAPTEADLPQKPNIIVIFADDLGFGDTGVYNQISRCGQGLPCIQTPRIDQMAAEGMRFINMYSCGPECSPARGGLMTGFHTGHATVRDNGQYLRREDITVAEVLKRGGYATAFIGKWGIGTVSGQTSPERKGFDFGYGYLDNAHAWEHYTDYLYRNGVVESIPENSGSPGPCTQEVVFTQDLFTNEALAFISSHTTTPFYLQLSYIIPHKWNVSPDLFSYGSESWPTIEKHFAAQVTYMDRDVGRILDRLVQLGIADRTLVILTSDNGPQQTSTPDCGSHSASFFDGNAYLRDIKFTLYEGGIREPFIAWWPGVIQPGVVNTDFIVSLEDFMPTAAELAGVPVPSGIDGVSYVPTLTGQGMQVIRPYFYWENGTNKAVRAGQYKGKWGSTTELFDLAADPGESSNLASNPAYSAILAQLTQYRNAASWTGAPPVTSPVLALTGDVSGAGGSYTLDFGTVAAGPSAITRKFRVRNAATSYSNLLEGTLDFQFTDGRLSGTDGSYAWLVDSSGSEEFVVTLTPSSLGTISGQVVITGRKYSYNTAAVNSPITLQVTGQVVGTIDCNNNGVPDDQDISGGTSADCNANNVPDECEVPPLGPPSGDCNANGIPDVCDVPPIGGLTDCNGNQIPDVCEPDCNSNGTADECEVPPLGTGADCNSNQILDDCELDGNDCNENGIPDDCDVMPPFDYGQAYWRFSTLVSNIVEDEGPNNLDGTTNGRPYLSPNVPVNPVPQNGFANTQSLNMNWGSVSTVGYFTVPHNSALSMGDQSFTLEAWVKLDYLSNTGSADERQWLFMKKGNAASDNLIDYALLAQRGQYSASTNYGKNSGFSGRELVLLFGTGSAVWSITSHLEITDTNWHFISVTFDPAGSARFGIDNTFQTETFTNGTHTTNTATLKVGVHTNTSGTFNQGLRGSVDEMRISRGLRPLGELLNVSGTATSEDVNGNGIPDECEDCNGNGILDDLDIAGGTSLDCQSDGIPDECQVEGNDCNSNGIPDECEGGFNNLDVFIQELLADSPNPALLCVFDLNHDGSLDGSDIQPFIGSIIP